MKSLLKCVALTLVVGLLLYGVDALAAGNEGVFKRAANIMITTFKNVRMIVYILGAFGLIGIAIGGIFGKINFKWLAWLAVGLAIIAGADAIIRYATQDNSNLKSEAEGGYTEFDLK